MTKEEAISILQNYKMSCNGCEYDHELGCELDKNCSEAIDMAIVALEKQSVVEFVSYDGAYPNLCSGTLILKINGVERTFPKYCMQSGGSVSFDKDWNETVTSGLWSVDVPEDLYYLKEEIERCVNKYVPHGCCGGCV